MIDNQMGSKYIYVKVDLIIREAKLVKNKSGS